MACASPSTTADLPTPGSPMSTGLFLVRRESTWIILSISFLRPMTGSILPSRAFCVRLTPYFSISPPRNPTCARHGPRGRCCSANLETNDSKGSRFISLLFLVEALVQHDLQPRDEAGDVYAHGAEYAHGEAGRLRHYGVEHVLGAGQRTVAAQPYALPPPPASACAWCGA